MKKYISLSLAAFCIQAAAETVDFGKIENWSGDGENRAALIVQFNDGLDNAAYVWGFRWPAGTEANGEKMFRTICAENSDLYLLTQFTGSMGSTVNGIGMCNDSSLPDHLYFDFDMARDYAAISFDYYTPNAMMGQLEAPGDDTPRLCADAIAESRSTHIIQHPIDARTYGYPAYDYDCWKLDESAGPDVRWQAGWYEGYWSYWTGSENNPDMGYSGVGFTGRVLADGAVDGWSYVSDMNDWEGAPIDGELIYVDAAAQTAIAESRSPMRNADVYDLQGRRIAAPAKGGLYILNGKLYKF